MVMRLKRKGIQETRMMVRTEKILIKMKNQALSINSVEENVVLEKRSKVDISIMLNN